MATSTLLRIGSDLFCNNIVRMRNTLQSQVLACKQVQKHKSPAAELFHQAQAFYKRRLPDERRASFLPRGAAHCCRRSTPHLAKQYKASQHQLVTELLQHNNAVIVLPSNTAHSKAT